MKFLILSLRILGILLLAAAIPAVGYFLARQGPVSMDKVDLSAVKDPPPPEFVERWEKTLLRERQLLSRLELEEYADEDVQLLEDILVVYDEMLGYDPPNFWDIHSRQEELEFLRQNLVAYDWFEESRQLEAEGDRFLETDLLEEARFAYKRAASLQVRINTECSRSDYFDPLRSTRLSRKSYLLEAEPLYRKSRLLESEAEFAAEAGDFDLARKKIQEALVLQQRLVHQYMDTPQASLFRLTELENRLKTLLSAEIHEQIQAWVGRAQRLVDEQNLTEAKVEFARALEAQRKLNIRFPDSNYASSEKLKLLEREIEKIRGRSDLEELQRGWAVLGGMLVKREVYNVRERLPGLLQESRALLDRYPLSRKTLEPFEFRLSYLDLIQEDLGAIQDLVYAQLRPYPEQPGQSILGVEVSQNLFERVMGNNPSSRRDPTYPVDRVTFEECQTFCERLSWILGMEVRLPTAEGLRQLAGRESPERRSGEYWSFENSEGAVQAVGSSPASPDGLHDLLGNVSEWTIHRGTGEASIFGGSAAHGILQLVELPVEAGDPSQRQTLVGFRFVVVREAGGSLALRE